MFGFSCRELRGGDLLQLVQQVGTPVGNLYQATYLAPVFQAWRILVFSLVSTAPCRSGACVGLDVWLRSGALCALSSYWKVSDL